MTDEMESKDTTKGEHVLREKVDEYKKAHPEALPEFDFAFLMKSLKRVNEHSLVKIARNAINAKREWIPGTETWNVSKVYLSEDRCVTFVISHGEKTMSVEDLIDQLNEIDKKLPMKNIPIEIQLDAETRVKATELYAHALVTDIWAGMPADFVLCFAQTKTKQAATAEPTE